MLMHMRAVYIVATSCRDMQTHIELAAHQKLSLIEDLESLGVRAVRLNEFNDNSELRCLADAIKTFFLKEYCLSSE
jgi:hypothetical protein